MWNHICAGLNVNEYVLNFFTISILAAPATTDVIQQKCLVNTEQFCL